MRRTEIISYLNCHFAKLPQDLSMSRFYKFRRNPKYWSSGRHDYIQDTQPKFMSNGTSERILKLKRQNLSVSTQNYDDRLIKSFLSDLLRSSKPLKGINSSWGRTDEGESKQYVNQIQLSNRLKNAIMDKFRKSDTFALSIFNTIGVLMQEINSIKDMLSEPKFYSSQFRSSYVQRFEIDSLTDEFVKEFKKAGILPNFTSPAYIYILDSTNDMDLIIEKIRKVSKSIQGGLRVVGLDVETGHRSTYSAFPSILQIALNKNIVIIFQVI